VWINSKLQKLCHPFRFDFMFGSESNNIGNSSSPCDEMSLPFVDGGSSTINGQ
jgi:hypothetical protein